MITNIWTNMTPTAKRHMKAICGDAVAKTNVIGLRKAFNAQARKDRGLSVGMTSPNVTAQEVADLDSAIGRKMPKVIGELHESGLKVLRNKRYRNRFTPEQRDILDNIAYFRLVAFEWLDSLHCVPCYRAYTSDGRNFAFRIVPWQSEGNGPEIFA